MRRYQDLDHLDGLTRCLGALSTLALAREYAGLAGRLIGAAGEARDRTGLTPWPSVTEAERRTIERAEALLPDGEFTAQVTAGRSQTVHDAFTQAWQEQIFGSPELGRSLPRFVISPRLEQRAEQVNRTVW